MAFQLLDTIQTPLPQVPLPMVTTMSVCSTCEISERLIKLFNKSFLAVAYQLHLDGILSNDEILQESLHPIMCVISNDDTCTFKIDESTLASVVSIAFYCISKWDGYDDKHICMFIIEELCHHFWNITNELDVNFKVFDILKHIFSDIRISDVYSIQAMKDEAARLHRTDIDFDAIS